MARATDMVVEAMDRYGGPQLLMLAVFGFDAVWGGYVYLIPGVFDEPWELPAMAAMHASRFAVFVMLLARPRASGRLLVPLMYYLLGTIFVTTEIVDTLASDRFHVAVTIGLAVAVAVYGSLPSLLAFLAGAAAMQVLLMRDPDAALPLTVAHTGYVVMTTVLGALLVYWYRHQLDHARARAEEQAVTDALTGLLNRRGLTQRVGHTLAQARREHGQVAVVVADLDHFKAVNDTLGHHTGDEVLVAAAARLRQCVRPHDVCARTGGEEFAAVLSIGPGTATAVAERIRESIAVTVESHRVTASVGAVSAEPPAPDADAMTWVLRLMERADALMYQAKEGGRDRVAVAA